MPEVDIVATLNGLMDDAKAPHDERWKARRAEIPRLAAEAVRKFARDGEDVKSEGQTDDRGDPDAEAIQRLMALSPMQYDRARKAEAEGLGVRVDTLDAAVRKARGDAAPDDPAGGAVMFPELAPWPEPVDGAALLSELAEVMHRFVVLPKHAAYALALWVVFTYCIGAVQIAPILAVVSPEKRCGKTTLLSLLIRLACRALTSSNISPSALFRAVEKWGPTLIIYRRKPPALPG